MEKKAVITVKLVDESIVHSNAAIAEEIRKWFLEETLLPPWVKEIDAVVVGDFHALSKATKCVKKYPSNPVARKHRNIKNLS